MRSQGKKIAAVALLALLLTTAMLAPEARAGIGQVFSVLRQVFGAPVQVSSTPTDGQVLTYDSSAGRWSAADAAGGLTGVTEDGGSPVNVVTVADSLVIDGGGGATGGLTINDSGSNADVTLIESGGQANLSGAAGIRLQTGGVTRLQINSTGTLIGPGAAGVSGLGNATVPFGSLTLGDGTAQVTLGHDGATDGLLTIADPNGVAESTLAFKDASGNSYGRISTDGFGTLNFYANNNGGSFRFYCDNDGTGADDYQWVISNVAIYPSQTVSSVSVGTLTRPIDTYYVGDGTNAITALATDGATDGKLVLSDPNSAAGAQLVLTDAAGNADVSLSETSGAASLSAPAGVFLQYNGSNRLYARTDGVQVQTNLRPFSAGGASLGSTAAPFDALTLGDGTAQVTLQGDGATDGVVEVLDSDAANAGVLRLTTSTGTGTGASLRSTTSNILQVRNAANNDYGSLITGAIQPGSNAYGLGSASARWASGHFGPTGLIVYDVSGNADVSLAETSGRATLSGASGIGLSNGTQFLYWIGNDLYSQTAGAGNLGTTTEPWGDLVMEDVIHVTTEQGSDPAAPSTNGAKIYLTDTGGGKTQLCVRFATGAVQVIATEP